MPDELHAVDGLLGRHELGGELLLTDDDGTPVVARLLLHHRNGARGDLLDHLGRRGHDVDDAEAVGGSLAQRGGTTLTTVHLLAVLRLADALDELVVGEVEGGVLVGGSGLGTHDRSGADERQFDAVAVGSPAALVTTHELDLEGECTRREVLDLLGLLGDVILETIRDPNVASGDGDIHGGLPDPARSAAYGSGGRLLRAFRATVARAPDFVTGRSP